MFKVSINRSVGIVNNKCPLIFLKRETEERWDDIRRCYVEECFWKSTNAGFLCTIPYDSLPIKRNYLLVAPDNINQFNLIMDNKTSETTFSIHAVKSSSVNDTILIFNQVINRYTTTPNIYHTMELLWFLNFENIEVDILEKALSLFKADPSSLLVRYIKECSVCLSYFKQSQIKTFLDNHGGYNIYYPSFLVEAVSESLPHESYKELRYNLFALISILLGITQTERFKIVDFQSGSNPLLLLKRWLNDESFTYTDFLFIERIISFLSPDAQFLIIKRYFLDVYKGRCVYDSDFLSRLSNNKYHRFQTYRNSIYAPSQAIDLTVPMLIDSINTYISTNGAMLQQFDGILDKFIRNTDPFYVNVDFGLSQLLPVCNGGAVYNQREFKGFIDFHIILSVNNYDDRKEQTKAIYNFLDSHFKRARISSCSLKFGNRLKYCSECEAANPACYSSVHSKYCSECNMLRTEIYDKWIIPQNHPCREAIMSLVNHDKAFSNDETILSIQRIDDSDFVTRLKEYIGRFTVNANTGFAVKYSKMQNLMSVSEFITFHTIRFWIRNNIYFGRNILNLSEDNDTKYTSENIQREKQVLRQLLAKSLEQELGTKFNSSGKIEIKYDEIKLRKVMSKYYYVSSDEDDSKDIPFLVSRSIKFKKFCAPEYENNYNAATSLPFFWCRGKECFKNSLSCETLATVPSWRQYSLLHILEILGYPQLTGTPAGNQPSVTIRAFIALINRAKQIVSRLSCRECGHLMYPAGKTVFNMYNYFSCSNPSCKEFSKSVYLSFCNSCKKGLIDSRDNAQCPNNWYICPSCLGCCNDSVIERQIQKYVISNRPVPYRLAQMRGKGHNDKKIFYCPVCGTKLENEVIMIHDVEERDILVCHQCGYKKENNRF